VDNLRTSPTAAVCSSCHDSAVAKTHMQDSFNRGIFSATQAQIDSANATTPENCTFCHGAGKSLDVKTAHGIP
jgi:formate-dependent nitrite reductase cytochrome c552 subunit